MTFERYILTVVTGNPAYGDIPISPEVMVKFYCGGMTTLLFWWFENEDIPIEEIRQIIRMMKVSPMQ